MARKLFQFKYYVNGGGGVSVWAGNAEGWGSNIGAKVILECSLMRHLITTPPFIGHHDNAKSGGNRVRENYYFKMWKMTFLSFSVTPHYFRSGVLIL